MKKTKYFLGSLQQMSETERSMEIAIEKKEQFMLEHLDEIDEVDNENINIITWHGNNLYAMAIITLTYYPKKNEANRN